MKAEAMKTQTQVTSKLVDSETQNMQLYWQQSRLFDSRSYDTYSLMGGCYNEQDSQQCFELLLTRLNNRF